MKNKSFMNKKAFTLTELLAVMVIIGIIAIISIPLIRNISNNSNEKKFKLYSINLENASKLYVDSKKEDLFGNKPSGCAYIRYSDMFKNKLIKDIGESGITCNSNYTYVKVIKLDNRYAYYTYLGCGPAGSDGLAKTIKYPNDFDTNTPDVNSLTDCTGVLKFNISVKKTTETNNGNSRRLAAKIVLNNPRGTGVQNGNINITYAWTSTRDESGIIGVWTPADFDIPSDVEQMERILSHENNDIYSSQIMTPTGVSGKYYKLVKINALADLFNEPYKG